MLARKDMGKRSCAEVLLDLLHNHEAFRDTSFPNREAIERYIAENMENAPPRPPEDSPDENWMMMQKIELRLGVPWGRRREPPIPSVLEWYQEIESRRDKTVMQRWYHETETKGDKWQRGQHDYAEFVRDFYEYEVLDGGPEAWIRFKNMLLKELYNMLKNNNALSSKVCDMDAFKWYRMDIDLLDDDVEEFYEVADTLNLLQNEYTQPTTEDKLNDQK